MHACINVESPADVLVNVDLLMGAPVNVDRLVGMLVMIDGPGSASRGRCESTGEDSGEAVQ